MMELETRCDGGLSDSDTAAIWEEIDVAEKYLVCSMYQESASTASSILNRLSQSSSHHLQLDSIFESTSMILLQSFHLLSRTNEILSNLKRYFISIKAIPPQLILTLACFQIEQGSALDDVQQYLEDFLNEWSPADPQYSTLIAEPNVDCETRYGKRHFVLEIDQYLQLVELYAVTLLATVLKHVDLAISWVENNASLPEENRQALLRRLHSMHSLKSTTLKSPTDNMEAYSLKELNVCEGSPKALSGKHANNEKYASKEAVLKLSERIEPYFWCFRSINVKFGSTKFVISSGKIMLGCLMLFTYYLFRKKQSTLKRIVRRQLVGMKRAVVDLWQLAFSHQVNPLAAVQPLSTATRQAR
ncbi:hypothetical protein TanjilG_20968 [Lupinus angustifolius]|uniref:Protein APEM9 n=1 Tax=Lupinus angustifolius TaxID=3871 RepID=A0A1J7GR78_LUPAN|nr:PREDICTED: uncharacterized protein LOC109358942 [Lupinus angustifolius]OIW03040.1 hypothetical protein TanjilG_20968 [Lupinus angustifolius]